MEYKFRDLKPEEIDVRIATVKSNGISLLLYKDARVDMDILDETVGANNWERDHKELKGNIYCGISIWDEDKKQWIIKWDAGKESYTEAEKGEASDSFKRAGFNWGIGRELYTSPFIWIPSDLCKIEGNKCSDKFKIKEIQIENKVIKKLVIVNEKTNIQVFPNTIQKTTDNQTNKLDNTLIAEKALITETEAQVLVQIIKDNKLDINNEFLKTYKKYGYNKTIEIKQKDYKKIVDELKGKDK